ncbi:hypothetical protein K2173_017910 [Erythroxylum novogranatense]|uniref:Nucleolar 27S pre-rRNA processing Urb2/Npa2 C-terminal domain-containing protein n=1 Tax=Erythroxylum novogranatense TaxID=1862640 RepID=A0AAV8TMC1_9ROSI|nr:hypothetical protein K2173_017910 [Erythroxylum novogranatense]
MADLSAKKRKRKLKSSDEKERPDKALCFDDSNKETEPEEGFGSGEKGLEEQIRVGRAWRNLQLILSLQNKEIELQKKLELAFDYVKSKEKEGEVDVDEGHQTVNLSRLVVFLNDWVQSLLISGDKKGKRDGVKTSSGVSEACLDYRCWVIFKFSLKEALRLQLSLSFSRNILRAIWRIATRAMSLLEEVSLLSRESFFFGEGFELYTVALDCISLLFLSHGNLSNENLDLWISTARSVLDLVWKVCDENLESGNAGTFAFRFCILVLEPFAKFLRVHPLRKNNFHCFLDELLEPLLHLLVHFNGRDHALPVGNVMIMVEEVILQGLFHPIHIDGFLSLRSSGKYLASNEGKIIDSMCLIKSYHRHLFDKLHRIMATKKGHILSGLGQLFHLLVNRVRRPNRVSLLSENTKIGKSRGSAELMVHSFDKLHQSSDAVLDTSSGPANLNAEKRKSLLEFFVQIMDPLLLQLNEFLHAQLEGDRLFLDVHYVLKAINSLLATFLHEQLYLKTEDVSEGAYLNFLKKIYDIVFLFATNILGLPTFNMVNQTQKVLTLVARELLIAVGYFLDIEYQVIGDDSTKLWVMLISFLAFGQSFKAISFLKPTVFLLLQVNNTIYAFSKAIRHVMIPKNVCNGGPNDDSFLITITLPLEAYVKPVGILLSTKEFKLAFHNVIKSIPEGQVSESIRQLNIDVSETMEWMNDNCSAGDIQKSDPQSELLGIGLSEMYAVVLDSLSITVGNCSLVGQSVQDLITAIRPYMNILIGLQPDSFDEFETSVTGTNPNDSLAGIKHCILKRRLSTHWIIVFFFRLYMSCRSLYRQAISLMPPKLSKKMSALMGDSFSGHSGRDYLDKTDCKYEGYFSWIIQSSASLSVTMQSISDIYLQDSNEDCSPLVYLLHVMAIQRLVDLNRQINSFEYIQKKVENVAQMELLDDNGLLQYHSRRRKCKRHISVLKQEASDLTEFMINNLSLVGTDQLSVNSDDMHWIDCCDHTLLESGIWDLDVCSLNKKSLPTAVWWIVCQNVDSWSNHASKKNLKLFLSHLISASLPLIARSFSKAEERHVKENALPNKLTVNHISAQLLSNSDFYEHSFVSRHLASRFCDLLEKSVVPLFGNNSIGAVDLKSLPNWEEVLRTFEQTSIIGSGSNCIHENVAEENVTSHSTFEKSADISQESTNTQFTACQSLLSLLCWMPKGYMSKRSFSRCVTYILNLERLVIGNILDCQRASSTNKYELVRLLLSCRRALKFLIVAYYEEKAQLFMPVLSGGSLPILWFFKSMSVVSGLQDTLSDGSYDEIRCTIYSFMDQTSYAILTISKYESICAFQSLCAEKYYSKQLNSDDDKGPNSSSQFDRCLGSFKDVESWKNILVLAESLKEQTQDILTSLKDDPHNNGIENGTSVLNLTKISSLVSCFSGFLWGLASALDLATARDRDCNAKLMKSQHEPAARINLCINVFADLISFSLRLILRAGVYPFENLCDAQNFLASRHNILCLVKQQKSDAATICSTSSNPGNDSQTIDLHRHGLGLEDSNSIASVLNKIDSFECQSVNGYLLESLLRGHHPKTAILIRQLLVSYAAIAKLNLKFGFTSFLSILIPNIIDVSQIMLLKFVDMDVVPQPFPFIWLDGVMKFLQELGSHFPLTNPSLTRDVYVKLIVLHIKTIGKCISLQGKEATLESHETESSTKILHGHTGSTKGSLFHLNEIKARSRLSFKALIKRPSELHMLSAVQALERALVGVNEGHTSIYEITTGNADGGKVSSTVAAGVDCLDLLLENVSGRKRLSVVKRHIKSLIAPLFNVILHLQNPSIFCRMSTGTKGDNDPDPGAVILMCVEIVTRISAKHALFHMDTWHVGQSLGIPAALFRDFGQVIASSVSVLSNSFPSLDNKNHDQVEGMPSCALDQQFTVGLFTASCRLLSTTLKHHYCESERCIAVLQESVRILLSCLEMADSYLVTGKDYSSWDTEAGVRGACSLRRIYEELRQQKDAFGQHCSKFLSDYIRVHSGCSGLKAGLKREIDEALRPGIYALIDVCSADDLQHLHLIFGETHWQLCDMITK